MIITRVSAEITVQLKGSDQIYTLIVFEEETGGCLAAFVGKAKTPGSETWEIRRIPSELESEDVLQTVFERLQEYGAEDLVQPQTASSQLH